MRDWRRDEDEDDDTPMTEPMRRKPQRKAHHRSAEHRKATGNAAFLEAIATMDVKVETVPQGKLLHEAILHYREQHPEVEFQRQGLTDTLQGRQFARRMMVNFIRHRLTTYDALMSAIAAGQHGHTAMWTLRERTYEAIGRAYPHLEGECRRQMLEREQAQMTAAMVRAEHGGAPART